MVVSYVICKQPLKFSTAKDLYYAYAITGLFSKDMDSSVAIPTDHEVIR